MRPIKLLHVTTVPESLGFFTGQIGYMKEHGFEVHAMSSPGEMLERFGEREGVQTHSVRMPRKISPVVDAGAVARMRGIMSGISPDIVHAHTPKGGLFGTTAAWLAGVPVRVYHIHGIPIVTARGGKRAILRASERVACRLATQVLCVSHSVMNVILAEGLCAEGKIKVLNKGSINGVDACGRFNPDLVGGEQRSRIRAETHIPQDAVVLGFVGRIVRDKGLVELAQAWQRLSEQFAELHMMVVGPFEPQDRVPECVVRMLRTDPRIHMAGYVTDMPRYYAGMDVVALPSYREGFSGVPLEAGAMGLPAVVSDVPGCAEAVRDGVTGTVVRVRDAAALEGAIRRYVEDAGLRARHGRAARELVRKDYTPEGVWEAQLNEYWRLLDAAGVRC